MAAIPRSLSPRLHEAARFFPALFVGGCRQAGKTTLLRAAFPSHRYVTLDLPSQADLAERRPDDLLGSGEPLLIDELQYAPGLARHLKARIDAGARPGTYLLTGSQIFPSLSNVSESLAGRCAVLSLHTLGAGELASAGLLSPADVVPLLLRGGFPQLWAEPELPVDLFYASYLATYLERDVRNLVNVGSLRDFERFVRALAARSGELLSYTDLARDVGASVSTVREWCSVLTASHVITLLEPYHRSVGKRLVKSPKVYFDDAGFAAWLCGIRTREQLLASPRFGPLWETLVHGELRRRIAVESPGTPLWFWAAHGTAEVDFVLESGERFHLLEAKAATEPGSDAMRGFHAFARAYGKESVVRRTVVCRAATAHVLQDGTEVAGLAGSLLPR